MLMLAVIMFGELTRTSSFIDIPMVPEFTVPGTFGGAMMFSLPMFSGDPDTTDTDRPDHMNFNMAFKYGYGPGEIALSMFSLNTYVLSGNYLIMPAKGAVPALFCGVDDISYSPYISPYGFGEDRGSLDEVGYTQSAGGRVWELFSAYFACQQQPHPYINLVAGLGRGRFMGNSWRSHVFNTDLFITGSDYSNRRFSAWALGLFLGGSVRFPFGLELGMEMDGRDANVGIKYHSNYVTGTLAMTKVEYLGSFRPFTPSIALGVEASNKSMVGAPKYGSIECIAQDGTSKTLLANVVVDIKELNKRYKAVGGTFTMSLPADNYTITVIRPDYVDYMAKVSVKPGTKSKFVFNMKKTEDALRRELAAREKDMKVAEALNQGKVYFSEGKLVQAKQAFETVITLSPTNAEALDYLSKIDARRVQLIAVYTTEARDRTAAKDYKKALEFWQKVLDLDAANAEAKVAIADLNKKISTVVVKKPPDTTKPPDTKKPSAEEIAALYNKGVGQFSQAKYDEALQTFKKVLALDPNHKGAKDYRKRTEARLKALKGG